MAVRQWVRWRALRVKRAVPVLAVLTVLGLVVGACGGGAAAPAGAGDGTPQRGGTVVFSWNSDPQTLDAVRCGNAVAWGACQAIYGTLMNYDAGTGKFSPGMAESFTSDDGKVWTLKLREGVKFSDGTPFDAAAVVFNWDRAKDPVNLSPGASVARNMTYAAVDARTVRVTLPQTNWQLPWSLYIELAFIGSPTAIQQKGQDFANAPVGAGPFVFTAWARGTRLDLSRNPTYWDQPRPYVDAIAFAPIGADDQRLNALRAGNITVMSTLTDEYADRATSEGFVDHTMPSFGGVGVRVSWKQGPLADPDVRMAIAKLIDPVQINNALYKGAPAPATFSPPGSTWFDPNAVFPQQDVPGAQALIDGYRARNGGGDVVITYRLVGGIPLQDQVAQLFQAQVQRVSGLKLQIVALDIGAFVGDLNSGNYQLILNGFNGVNTDALYELFHTGASQNQAGYSDPATDAALERARQTNDPAQQLAAYQQAMEHIAANVGHRAWRYQTTHLLSKDTVHGIQPNFNYFLRSDLVWIQQ
jgi:peptide/nickel transport system substrate-binding protein